MNPTPAEPKRAGQLNEVFIAVPGGPEALVIDNANNVAYTNSRSTRTFAISFSRRRIIARWPNSCHQSRGLARRGHLHHTAVYHAAKDAHCVTADGASGIFVCAPKKGRILKFTL
jgi:hypothetical protein